MRIIQMRSLSLKSAHAHNVAAAVAGCGAMVAAVATWRARWRATAAIQSKLVGEAGAKRLRLQMQG